MEAILWSRVECRIVSEALLKLRVMTTRSSSKVKVTGQKVAGENVAKSDRCDFGRGIRD